MHPKIKAAARTAFCFVVLNGCLVVGAATAWAEVDAGQSHPLCEEGVAVLAGRLAYLEARISPAPDQQQAWQAFKTLVRAAVKPLDELCAEGPASGPLVNIDKLEKMERHAAAMQKVFAGLRAAIAEINPVLTSAQRDLLARGILPPPPPLTPPFPPSPGTPRFPPPQGGMFGMQLPPFVMTTISCGSEPLGPPLF